MGVHEAKSRFSELLDLVERGETITITRRARSIAMLVPMGKTAVDPIIFDRLRAMRERLALGVGESAKELITAGTQCRL